MKTTNILKMMMLIVAVCFISNLSAKSRTGVWVSDDAELLLTEKVTLYFERCADECVKTILIVDDVTRECTTFRRDTIIRGSVPTDFEIKFVSGNKVKVNGKELCKAESIEHCEPYDMPEATDRESIGERLSQWRLGTIIEYDNESKDIYVEVNTNKSMFLYFILGEMRYLRAARIENVNEGTLFCQNIRLMKQPTTGEFTIHFSTKNKSVVMDKLDINLSAFNPEACYTDPNGGIYWSYTSHSPNQIVLNGCAGDTYYIKRRLKSHDNVNEWIKYTK